MASLREFQIYLLGQMKAKQLVKETLKALGASPRETQTVKERMVSLGFEVPGHPADLYTTVLGTPVAVEPLPEIGPESPFARSVALRFHLPLWPGLDYLVNKHPAGYAWGWRFGRRLHQLPPTILSLADLKPWSVVSEDLARFGPPKREDAWEQWESNWYLIPARPGGLVKRCLLSFDFNLLQGVEVVEDLV